MDLPIDMAPEPQAEMPSEREALRTALEAALKYWSDRQQRYKNRSPVWVQLARAALSAQPKRAYREDPEPLSEFDEGQWWVHELDKLARDVRATDDQKRAVAVVHHLLASARVALAAQQAAQAEPAPEFNGWYCAHCQRGVDGSEVTFREQHTVCGRVITNDRPPAPGQVERDRENADYLCKLVDAIGKDVLGVLKQYGDAQAAIGLMASRTKDAIRDALTSAIKEQQE